LEVEGVVVGLQGNKESSQKSPREGIASFGLLEKTICSTRGGIHEHQFSENLEIFVKPYS
jgi:hypothetical protein